ncbi:MAG: NUDIX hydrolase [Patescibacteria group bacterium]
MADEKVIGPTVVCSGLIQKDDKFLMVFCPRFKVWRVPGGRAEFNETLEQTFVREMKEEIGLDLVGPKFLGWGQDHQFHVRDQYETSRLLMFFYVKINEEPIIDPDEAEEFKWVTLVELKNEKNKEGALTDFFNRNPKIDFANL